MTIRLRLGAAAIGAFGLSFAMPPWSWSSSIFRMSARLSAEKGDLQAAEEGFIAAIDEHRKRGDPFVLARPLAELAELLIAQGRVDEADPLLAEAQEIFERLGALPWLERIERIQGTVPRVASGV